MFFALVRDTFVDGCTHFGDVFPGDGGFEGLGDEVVLEAEVADVGDHEGQEVTSLAILGPRSETFVLFD